MPYFDFILIQGTCKLTTQQKQQLRDATREYAANTINLHLQRERLKEELLVRILPLTFQQISFLAHLQSSFMFVYHAYNRYQAYMQAKRRAYCSAFAYLILLGMV